MRAHAEEGPAFESDELEVLQVDLQEEVLGQMCDALFRIARSACCVIGTTHIGGSQEFFDLWDDRVRLLYAFDGRRLVMELRPEEGAPMPMSLLHSHERA
ncbi:MAG: hypothetical protein IT513_14125 [Burkholderiales bacterium]|nr:hypothetical protein [Burkholderiales bacterium]